MDTPLDCIRKDINDLRTGSAFARANLIIMHPNTWADLQLLKNTQGSYLLNPSDPNALGALNDVFGVPVIATTKIAAGTAIVADTTQAVLAWTRMAPTLDVNSYGTDGTTNQWTQNAVSFRVEERIAIGVMRPTALNIVTGLPV